MNLFRSRDPESEPAAAYEAPRQDGPDPRELLARFRRRLPLFAVVGGSVFLIAAALTFAAKPIYTATAVVLVDPRQREVLKVDKVVSNLPNDSGVVDTEVKILSSRAVAERVVNSLSLGQDPDFKIKPGTSTAHAVRASLTGPERPAASNQEKVVDKVLRGLAVKRTGLTYAIDVSFSSPDPKKAARIANAFTREYLNQQIDTKRGDTEQASGWVKAKLDSLRAQAEAADAQVQYYKIGHGLMSAEGATLAEQEISALNKEIAVAQATQAEKEGRLAAAQRQMERGGGGADTAAALGSDVVSKLRSQRAEVSRHKAELENRYGPLHPEVDKVNRELGDYDYQIKEELARIQSNLKAEVEVARQRTSSLVDSRGAARGSLASNNQAQVGLMELQRRAEAAHTIYEAFLKRTQEIAAQASIQQADASIVSKAQTPTSPSAPNTQLNLALGLVFALAAGMASVVGAESLDGAFRTGKDVQQRLGLTTLGNVPTLNSVAPSIDRGTLKPEDYVVQRPRSAFAEAFRSLKTALVYSRPGQTVQVVAVTSAMPEEGKTLTTVCLGRLAALGGSRVVIVDCDLRHRSLSQRVPGPVKSGLFEVLNGTAKLEQTLRKDEPSGAFILPVAEHAWSDPDVFRSPQMEALLTRLRKDFDLVLLDTPPVLAVSDTRVLATTADAVLYLLRWGKTPKPAVESAIDQLVSAGAFVPGVALTQVDMRQQTRTGYGDSSYYYDSFKKYYTD